MPQRRAAARWQRPRIVRGLQGLHASSVVDAQVSVERRAQRLYQGECMPVQDPPKQAGTAVMHAVWCYMTRRQTSGMGMSMRDTACKRTVHQQPGKACGRQGIRLQGPPTSRRWRRPRATSAGSSGAASCTSSGGRAASMLKLKSAHASYSPSRTSRQVCSRTTASAACRCHAKRSDLRSSSGAPGLTLIH